MFDGKINGLKHVKVFLMDYLHELRGFKWVKWRCKFMVFGWINGL